MAKTPVIAVLTHAIVLMLLTSESRQLGEQLDFASSYLPLATRPVTSAPIPNAPETPSTMYAGRRSGCAAGGVGGGGGGGAADVEAGGGGAALALALALGAAAASRRRRFATRIAVASLSSAAGSARR